MDCEQLKISGCGCTSLFQERIGRCVLPYATAMVATPDSLSLLCWCQALLNPMNLLVHFSTHSRERWILPLNHTQEMMKQQKHIGISTTFFWPKLLSCSYLIKIRKWIYLIDWFCFNFKRVEAARKTFVVFHLDFIIIPPAITPIW